jgi:hypothetical protein
MFSEHTANTRRTDAEEMTARRLPLGCEVRVIDVATVKLRLRRGEGWIAAPGASAEGETGRPARQEKGQGALLCLMVRETPDVTRLPSQRP